MGFPGPVELGRGVIVSRDGEPPTAWKSCRRIVVGEAEVNNPSRVVEVLHDAWLERRPVVIDLSVEPRILREGERWDRPVYELSPIFEFARDRLQFLLWANNYDARGGEPVWWHARKAARRFTREGVVEGGPADITLRDGTALFVDGGPRGIGAALAGSALVHRWDAESGSLRPTGDGAPTADLASDQVAAVAHGAGPARVIAPAGSGKTRVLTERLRHLLVGRAVHPTTVTALAYNVKAAEELRHRCADLLTREGPHIRTLNSLGLWICNDLGPGGRHRVLEEAEVRALLERLFEVRHQANTDTLVPYIDALSAIRLGLRSPGGVQEAIPDASGIAGGFERYRKALAEMGAVDFDEQIYRAVEILVTDPEARAAAQARCRYMLVDEFQDLTPAHLLLIRLLAAPGYDCFGVGDDDQVIYGYSGATPQFLIDFPRYFPGAGDHALEVNYRCPPTVVDAARKLLSYNERRLEKVIRTPDGRRDEVAAAGGPLGGSGPLVVRGGTRETLAPLAADLITAWRSAGVDPGDIAVLARVNSVLLPVQIACIEAGIPCTRPLDAQILSRTGIRTAFAYLRIGTDPAHIAREDVLETIRRPPRSISPKVLEMLTRYSATSVADIRRLASRLSGRDVSKLAAYADALEEVSDACAHSTASALRTIRVAVGLGHTMDVLDSSRREADRPTHADDLLALESVAAFHPDPATFESWLREMLSSPAAKGPTVLVSTVHRIKGREWGHVIVFGASRGLFPHRLSDDEEGERRVFHVALTRARSQVVVLVDVEEPSIFVAELNGSRARPRSLGGGAQRQPVRRKTQLCVSGGPGEARRDGEPHPSRGLTVPIPGGSRGRSRRSKHPPRPARAAPTIEAEIGLVIEHRGHTGKIVELRDDGAVIAIGVARVGVPFGSDVSIDGKGVALVAPRVPVSGSPQSAAAERALRAWRSDIAHREGMPAYVVLNDRELTGIAVQLPATFAELAKCRGMGQVRLDRWGGEILAVLEEARVVGSQPPA